MTVWLAWTEHGEELHGVWNTRDAARRAVRRYCLDDTWSATLRHTHFEGSRCYVTEETIMTDEDLEPVPMPDDTPPVLPDEPVTPVDRPGAPEPAFPQGGEKLHPDSYGDAD